MIYQRKYDWGTFTGLSVSAQAAGEVLERIESEHGAVSKKAFLEASRPADSPTHELFEWDDEKAAEKYRLKQSGRYIRDLKVTVVTLEPQGKSVNVKIAPEKWAPETWEGPAFMNAGESRLSDVNYSNVYDALRDNKKRENLLKNAKKELSIFRRKYDKISELSGVFKEVDKLIGGDE